MKLTDLSKWHLEQLENLSDLTAVEYSVGQFEFFSGISKLGNTTVTPTKFTFIVSERYETFVLSETGINNDLTEFFHG